MKKYTKPAVEVVELSVKESLSSIPFSKVITKRSGIGGLNNTTVTIYKKTSIVNG